MAYIKVLLSMILFAVLTAIAIPTVSFVIKETKVEISNINPSDFGLDLILGDFEYKPALDLQGGYTVIFEIVIPDVVEDKRGEFQKTQQIIAQRMAKMGLKDYDFTSFINEDADKYQLHLTTPDSIDDNLIRILASRGELDIVVDDPNAVIPEDLQEQSIRDGRKSSGITNTDIKSLKVISDSRVYANDPEAPNNFGLELVFNPDSKQKFEEAFIANAEKNMPLIFLLDDELVAVQSSGYFVNPYQLGDRMFLYTFLSDTKMHNSVLSAVMGSPVLENTVNTSESLRTNPILGEEVLLNLKVGVLAALILLHIGFAYFMRKSSIPVLISIYVFLIFHVAIGKILGFNLSLPLILGILSVLILFVLNQIRIIKKALKVSDEKKEKADFLSKNTLGGWKSIITLAITAPIIVFYENLLTVAFNQFVQSIILGFIIWILFTIIYQRTLLLSIINLNNREAKK